MGAIYTPTMTLEFWEDLSGLPSSINPKAIRTIHKMLKDPWSKELRPEKIEQAEKGIHSCRVDDGYRLIWKHIKPDNIVFCLVDNHDEAYRRARRKSFQLEDGIVKVVDILSAGKTEKYKNMDDSDDPEAWLRAIRKEPGKLFAGYLNDELIDMGVSEDNIANVRLLDSPDDLDLIERLFDEETYENLFYAALGETERSTVPDKELNKSLERYRGGDELYKFVDSDEFQRALQGDLEAWMLFLSPNQRQIALRDYNGPARVKGVAGSGKTVIAIHRVYHMYKLARDKDVKILFLTYGNRLPQVVEHLLERLSGEEDLDNTFLECTTIHKWCSAFLAEHAQRPNVNNYKLRSALSTAIGKVKQQPEFSDLAIFDRPRSFFKEEIAIAIKGRLVNSLEDYLALDRSGRGTPLQERERRAVYAIYEHYQDQLDSENICDWEDFVVQSVRILEQNPELQGQYRSAVVDEIQDFSEAAMRLISLLVPQDKGNNLFLVGDGLQRIYRGGYALSHLGIEVVGRSHLLRKNYRNTEETLRSAHAMMEQIRFDDMDDGKSAVPEPIYSIRTGPVPELHRFRSVDKELSWICEQVNKLKNKEGYKDRDFALVYRWRAPYKDEIEQQLGKHFNVVEITNNPETYFGDGVKHTTFHSAKGLEFKVLFIVGIADKHVPKEQPTLNDDEYDEYLNRERRLLYVAMTRARDLLYLSHARGATSRFLQDIPEEVLKKV